MLVRNPAVNRYLHDKAMDHIDHALGRSFYPLAETYRNYYATDLRSTIFYANAHWELGHVTARRMAYWHVTDAGRAALVQHLRDIQEPHRHYLIEFDGFLSSIIETTVSKARYSLWRQIIDAWPDLPFLEFARRAKVRVVP